MKKYVFFLLVLILAFAGTVYADIYTWEDEAGVSHITDYPPPAAQKGKNVKIFQNGDSGMSDEQKSAAAGKTPSITLYTKNDCPDCGKAREFLNSKKLAFTEYNLDQDPQAAAKRKEIDDSTDVPFAIINRNQVYGFSETVYTRALKP